MCIQRIVRNTPLCLAMNKCEEEAEEEGYEVLDIYGFEQPNLFSGELDAVVWLEVKK